MYISLDWLKDYVDIPAGVKPEELGELLTLKTAEVEGVESAGEKFANMVTGYVVTLKPHPNADKLKIAMTLIGKETVQIVCGGANLAEGMYVAVAKPGAWVKWHGEGDPVKLDKVKIRGEESVGMICQSVEIGMDNPAEGPEDILDLSAQKPEPGTPLAKFLGLDDIVLEFDNKSLTHRPDLWGHYGIAREVAAVTGGKFKHMEPKIALSAKGESVKVEIADYDLCPRYCGLIIEGIKVESSPEWMQKRLKSTGHGVHNNIVDVTNYVMHELGQPMHAFDKGFIEGGIVVRPAKKGEKMKTLDDKLRTLDESVLVIADHKKPVAIAGVMGGENSEINDQTTSIFLESANFNPSSIRRTSVNLGLRTDAVQHFEKSLDPHLAELAIKRAAELILQICPGAKIAGPVTDNKKFNEKPLVVNFDVKKAQEKIGIDISASEMKKIFESLEFGVAGSGDNFKITVPTFRSSKDVRIEDDLVEEVARMYGYDNVPATLPDLPTKLPMENIERFAKHRVRELLSYGLGLDEVVNYSFYGKDEIEKCLMKEEGHLKLQNYLSEDQTHMRYSLVPNLLKNVVENLKNFDNFGIYEIGRTYREVGEFFPLEEKRITGAIVSKKGAFHEAKGVLERLLMKYDVSVAKGGGALPFAHPDQALSYLHTGDTLGEVFSVHPTVLKNYGLGKVDLAFFCVNFTKLMKVEKEFSMYEPVPRFPGIELDVSVVVDSTTEVGSVKDAILKVDEKIVRDVEMFDLYEGTGVKEGKKAVAFRVFLRADDRTLTDSEMSAVQKKIFKNVEGIGGEVRGQ